MRYARRSRRNVWRGQPLRVALLQAALAALLAASLPAEADEALDAARARWRAAGPAGAYEYGYHKHCECYRDGPPETIVTVRDGRVEDVRHHRSGFDTDVRPEARDFDAYWTVEELFDVVANALERGSVVRVFYDDALGYPTRIFIDHDRDLIGDELDLELTRVTALPPR